MRRLFVIIPAILLVASFTIIGWKQTQYDAAQDKLADKLSKCTILLMHETSELRSRVQTLEKHLDITRE